VQLVHSIYRRKYTSSGITDNIGFVVDRSNVNIGMFQSSSLSFLHASGEMMEPQRDKTHVD
jgi:hypothetical protein